MKKLIAIVLALVMVLGLAACSGNDSGSKDKANVSVFWYDETDVYLGTVRSALNKQLEELGVNVDNQYAGANQATQIDHIKTAVSGGADLLIVNVVTSGAPDVAKQILEIAGNIPVIFFNRAIGTEGADVELLKANENICFIGTDAPEAGHLQGKMVGDYLIKNFDEVDLNGDGKISYAMFMGELGNAEAIFRTQYGVEDANVVLEKEGKPALEYFDASNPDKYQVDAEGKWSAAAAKLYMETNFVTFNEANNNMIELVICNNDGMAEGAIAALQEKGYNKEGKHVVPVFGVDATAPAQALIADGAMVGTVKQDAEGMATAIAQTVSGITGGASVADTLAGLKDERFSLDSECGTKLYVAYAPYTGE